MAKIGSVLSSGSRFLFLDLQSHSRQSPVSVIISPMPKVRRGASGIAAGDAVLPFKQRKAAVRARRDSSAVAVYSPDVRLSRNLRGRQNRIDPLGQT